MLKYIKILLLLIPLSFFGQNNALDSLKTALKLAKHDTTRCTILSAMVETENDANVWINYNKELEKLASANLETTQPNDPLHKVYLKYLADAYNNTAFLADETGDVARGLDYNNKSLKIQEQIRNKSGIGNSLNNIGGIYYKQGNVSKALEYFTKSLKISESINDYYAISRLLNNIGGIYYKQKELSKALEYYNKCLLINKLTDDVGGMASVLNNLGNLYYETNDINKALESFEKSLKLRESLNDKRGIAESMNNIGQMYFAQKKEDEALNYYNRSLNIQKEINDRTGISYTYNNIAEIYVHRKNYDKALEYCLISMKICKDLGYPENIEFVAYQLNEVYKAKGDYKNALQTYELYILMKDSVVNSGNRKASIRSQLKYEYEKKAAADSIKVAEEKKITTLQLKQEENQRYFLYGGLVLTMLFGSFMFNRFRVTKKQKNIINQQKTIVEHQKILVEEKQKEVMDSIRYAKRIQQSLLPTEKYFERILTKK